MEHNSPLSLVQHAFDVYTDEHIATPEAVADMAAAALATMGEDGITVAERAVAGLDPECSVPFGVQSARNLLQLADTALERGTPKDIRLGALAFLGVLSLAYDAQSPEPGAVGAAAREALWNVHTHATKMSIRDVSYALLTAQSKPAYDIAVELTDLPGNIELQMEERGIAATEASTSDDACTGDSRTMGEAVSVAVDELAIDPSLLAKMDWLSMNNVKAVEVAPIVDDGQAIAYAVNLMPYNDKLLKLSQDVTGNEEMAAGTASRLGVSLVHYARGGKLPDVRRSPKVKLLYTKNIGGNSRLTRAYFTPLGNHPADNAPMVGIVAMVAGKPAQAEALSMLTGMGRSFHRGSL